MPHRHSAFSPDSFQVPIVFRSALDRGAWYWDDFQARAEVEPAEGWQQESGPWSLETVDATLWLGRPRWVWVPVMRDADPRRLELRKQRADSPAWRRLWYHPFPARLTAGDAGSLSLTIRHEHPIAAGDQVDVLLYYESFGSVILDRVGPLGVTAVDGRDLTTAGQAGAQADTDAWVWLRNRRAGTVLTREPDGSGGTLDFGAGHHFLSGDTLTANNRPLLMVTGVAGGVVTAVTPTDDKTFPNVGRTDPWSLHELPHLDRSLRVDWLQYRQDSQRATPPVADGTAVGQVSSTDSWPWARLAVDSAGGVLRNWLPESVDYSVWAYLARADFRDGDTYRLYCDVQDANNCCYAEIEIGPENAVPGTYDEWGTLKLWRVAGGVATQLGPTYRSKFLVEGLDQFPNDDKAVLWYLNAFASSLPGADYAVTSYVQYADTAPAAYVCSGLGWTVPSLDNGAFALGSGSVAANVGFRGVIVHRASTATPEVDSGEIEIDPTNAAAIDGVLPGALGVTMTGWTGTGAGAINGVEFILTGDAWGNLQESLFLSPGHWACRELTAAGTSPLVLRVELDGEQLRLVIEYGIGLNLIRHTASIVLGVPPFDCRSGGPLDGAAIGPMPARVIDFGTVWYTFNANAEGATATLRVIDTEP